MTRLPDPLPRPLGSSPFSTRDAVGVGVPASRLRAKDLERLRRSNGRSCARARARGGSRVEEFVAAGWRVIRITADDVRHPARVLVILTEALHERCKPS